MGTRSQWKNFLSLTPFILCLFFLITIRLSYANNTREPWQFPYSWILLITVILFLVTTFIGNNVFSRLFYSQISEKGTLVKVVSAFIGILILLAAGIYLSSYTETLFLIIAMVISAFFAVMAAVYGGVIKYKYRIFLSFLFSSFFAAMVWIILSYSSYYTGVEFGAVQGAVFFENGVQDIILSNAEELVQKEKITTLAKRTYSRAYLDITIYKNGVVFLKPIEQKKPGYFLSKMKEGELKFNDVNGNSYHVSYQFYNRPELIGGWNPTEWGGLLKALLFSSNETNNIRYFKNEMYLRSLNFWWIFWVLHALILMFLETYQKQEEAIKEKEGALADLEDQRMILEEMRKDFNFYVNDSLNDLQPVHSSLNRLGQKDIEFKRHNIINDFRDLQKWGPEELEKVAGYDERVETYIKFLNFMEHEYYQKEYEPERGWSFLEDTYNIVISPWTKEIHEKLRKLDHIFEVGNKVVTVEDILDKVTSKDTIKKVPCSINVSDVLNKEATCRIIPGKLQDMVYNLLANSSHVGSFYGMKIRKESRGKKRFVKRIELNINEIEENNKTYLTIEVRDNCGGFPENIKDKIYVEPVPSIKDEGKKDKTNTSHGRGTYLIGFFARIMNISIEKDNISYPDGQKGASTTLKIPYL